MLSFLKPKYFLGRKVRVRTTDKKVLIGIVEECKENSIAIPTYQQHSINMRQWIPMSLITSIKILD